VGLNLLTGWRLWPLITIYVVLGCVVLPMLSNDRSVEAGPGRVSTPLAGLE